MAEYVDDDDRHRVVVTCIIHKGRRYLIKKRSLDGGGPYPGRWEVAGGGLDRADYATLPKTSDDGWENILDIVVRREVQEETGLVIGRLRFMGDFVFVREKDGIPVIGLRFAAHCVAGDVVLDREASEFRWIRANEVDRYDLIGSIADDIHRLDAMLVSEEAARPARK
jgi:8-oxo-dGTP pyrophosphatase MutT (NUDIX family)